MKLLYISDLHLRPTSPLNRKDDYVETQWGKLRFIIDYANEHEATMIIGGDLFDRAANHPSWFLNKVMSCFLNLNQPVHIIPGNHDLLGHDLQTVESNSIKLFSYLHKNCYLYDSNGYAFLEGSAIRFNPFGLPPDIENLNEEYNNILVLHEPVFEDTVPFYMSEALTVDELEYKYPGFDLYLAGDIHIPCQKSKTLVSGSMMRMTTAQKTHKPRFYMIDTETLAVETVFIPIDENVWRDVTETPTDEGFKAELQDLTEALLARDEQMEYASVCRKMSGDHWPVFDRLINEYETKKESV